MGGCASAAPGSPVRVGRWRRSPVPGCPGSHRAGRAPGQQGQPEHHAGRVPSQQQPGRQQTQQKPGKTNPRQVIEVWRDAKVAFSASLFDLQQAWDEVSWRICRLRDRPDGADAEHAAAGRGDDPGLHVHLAGAVFAADAPAAPAYVRSAPKVAIRACL